MSERHTPLSGTPRSLAIRIGSAFKAKAFAYVATIAITAAGTILVMFMGFTREAATREDLANLRSQFAGIVGATATSPDEVEDIVARRSPYLEDRKAIKQGIEDLGRRVQDLEGEVGALVKQQAVLVERIERLLFRHPDR